MVIIKKENEKVYMLSYKLRQEMIPKVPEKGMYAPKLVMQEDCYSRIDEDYSLIRYLCNETRYKDISSNTDNYITIKREDGTTTTLGRFILEYYADFDCKLYTVLNNDEYEINHINKDVTDNRLANLEIVTKRGNELHKRNKPYEDEIIMTSSELQAIQKAKMEDKKHNIDKEFMKRKSGIFHKHIKEDRVSLELIKYLYLDFKYVTSHSKKKEHSHTTRSNNSSTDRNIGGQIFLSGNHTNYINKLVNFHREYIYITIMYDNLILLNKFQSSHKDLDKVLTLFKINDRQNIKKSTLQEQMNSKTILSDLFDYLHFSNRYTINDDNILAIVNIKAIFSTTGRYKAFIVAYILGLLNRRKPTGKKRNLRQREVKVRATGEIKMQVIENHDASYISIPVYTEDLLKEADAKAKIIEDMDLRKITYFIVREVFGEKMANAVYVGKKEKRDYEKYGLMAKEDVIWFLRTNLDIHSRGYIFLEEIIEELDRLNTQRKAQGQPYSKIFDSFIKFVRSLLLYNPDVKAVMQKLRF